ncbi:MAG: recombinase family protein, partial [Betaproteobacteria bacterium]
MIACYLRVSTVGQNLAGKKAAITRWLNGNGVAGNDVRWFEDKRSGKDTDRPAFKELQSAVFYGEVETIVVWRLDRVSRSQLDGVKALHDWRKKGIRFVSVSEEFDYSGTVGQMIAGLLFSIAQMGREAMRENQRQGIEVAKKQGKYRKHGRKP